MNAAQRINRRFLIFDTIMRKRDNFEYALKLARISEKATGDFAYDVQLEALRFLIKWAECRIESSEDLSVYIDFTDSAFALLGAIEQELKDASLRQFARDARCAMRDLLDEADNPEREISYHELLRRQNWRS